MWRTTMLVWAVLALAPMAGAAADTAAAAPSEAVARALADPARAADQGDDTRRQAAAVLAFSGVAPGQVVLEIAPGGGYWTRLFSAVIGAGGHVYTVWPDEMAKYSAKSFTKWEGLVATPHYANVSLLRQPAGQLAAPVAVDLVFTAQNYHDYHDPFMGPVDLAAFNRQVFDALKPGGTYVVIDHVAAAGSGTDATDSLHRIDPAAVRREVEAAGFTFDAAGEALRNPADAHDKNVFDPAVRGHTDQFMYRFRKPVR